MFMFGDSFSVSLLLAVWQEDVSHGVEIGFDFGTEVSSDLIWLDCKPFFGRLRFSFALLLFLEPVSVLL